MPPSANYQHRLADAAAQAGLSQLWVMQPLSFSYPGWRTRHLAGEATVAAA